MHVAAFGDPTYPPVFAHLRYPPVAFFHIGFEAQRTALLRQARIVIVGTRAASSYGLATAEAFASAFAAASVVVLSGMALGIDGRAHTACLDSGGISAAILGCGADLAYPRVHRRLFERLLLSGGIYSELPPGWSPARWTFPLRNRLLAALADAVLVVEAGARSGAVITADQANERGRRVFAVPGAISSAASVGCNRLLFDGSFIALDPEETVQVFFAETRIEREGRGSEPPKSKRPERAQLESAAERLVRLALDRGPRDVDELVRITGLEVREVSAALALLEIRRLVVRHGPGRFALPP